jgi:hypothetical protein
MRKLDLLDRCPEARARERFAPATAAVGGRLTAEWAKDLLARSLNRMLERRRLWTTANPAARATDAMDLGECPVAVEPAKRPPKRRGVNRGIMEWSRVGHAVEQFYAGQRRSQPLPHARHRLDRDGLAAMATSARVSLSVPAQCLRPCAQDADLCARLATVRRRPSKSGRARW